MTSRMVGMVRTKPSATGTGALLAWYRPRPHDYPWRSAHPDPYAVLVSEVMLQQTQAARVAPAYRSFLERFPDVRALSSAARAELLRSLGRPGIPRRALALREAARAIVRDHEGRVPSDPAVLRTLPGVGPYTAAAVASIAFGVAVAAVDTNVRRVTARVVHGTDPVGLSPSQLQADADAMVDPVCARRVEPGGDGPRAVRLPPGAAVRRVPPGERLPVEPRGRVSPAGGAPPARVRGLGPASAGTGAAGVARAWGSVVEELAARRACRSSGPRGRPPAGADGLVSMESVCGTAEVHVRID
jgi:A/G-specific adenine glycosylase